MDTRKYAMTSQERISRKKFVIIQKTVASFATVFFIFCGTPVPTSLAAVPKDVSQHGQKHYGPVVRYDPHAAVVRPSPGKPEHPSGAAIQNSSPLSQNEAPQPADGPISTDTVAQGEESAAPQADDTLPPVPSGWSRAASNVNFAFKVEDMSLKLKDLITGTETIVASGHTGGYPAYVDSVYDVSPDGTTVIYAINNSAPYGSCAYLQRISDPSQKITVNGDLNSIRFEENGQVAVVNVQRGSAVDVRIDIATLQYHVPSGWSRAASNADFAYTIEYDGSVATLKVKDLRSGTEYTIFQAWGGGHYPLRFAGPVDISPDGSTVIYGTSRVMYGSSTYVQRIANASQVLYVPGIAQSIVFNGSIAVMTRSDGSEQWVDLNTLTVIPPVPPGWTRATSNQNFAFQFLNSGGPYPTTTLRLRNLLTGAEMTVASAYYPYAMLGGVYDVSPDGRYVIYSSSYHFPDGSWGSMTFLKKTADGTIGLQMEGAFRGLSTEGTETKVRLNFEYPDTTILQTVFSINFGTLARGTAVYAIVRQGSGWIIDDEAKVAVLITGAYQVAGRLMSFDTTNGLSQMSLLIDRGLAGGYPQRITFSEFYKTASGKGIYSYALDVVYGQENLSYVLDYRTGKVLTLTGLITAVSYEGNIAKYTLRLRDGTQKIQFVDLIQLSVVPPVPTGWTRAASNANYAFRVREVDGKQTLVVKNLRNGRDVLIVKPRFPRVIGDMYDVAPDGKTVVYSITSPQHDSDVTIVRSLKCLSKKISLPGMATGIQFVNGDWMLTINGRTVQVDPGTLWADSSGHHPQKGAE